MNLEKKVNERVDVWLKDTSLTLILSDLELTEWPGCLKGKEHLIIKLWCSNNQLTSLPSFLKLIELDCGRNRLKTLPSLPKLTKLWCDDNQLTSLPSFPKLTRLYCFGNQITSLPNFPKLTRLQCQHNQITSLPSFPKLTELTCSNNQLTSLPNFPKLTELICDYNQLTSLPGFPNLTWLYCYANQLTSLPSFPKLTKLLCSSNQLFSTELTDWKMIWPLQTQIKSKLRNKGIKRVVKVLKSRLYLPRLNQLHQELIYSPNHQGKFYKNLRIGDWSFENLTKKPKRPQQKLGLSKFISISFEKKNK